MKPAFKRAALSVALVTGLAASSIALAVPANAATAHKTATVGFFQAIPTTGVDVYIDNKKVANDLDPGNVAAGLQVSAGKHRVRIAEDWTKFKSSAFLDKTFTFTGGKNYSIIPHQNRKDLSSPVRFALTKYTNDTSPVADGKGRVTVRHVAAVTSVDVLVNGKVAIRDLPNPHEAKRVLPVGTYSVTVTGTYNNSSPVIGPLDLKVAANVNTIVYAWGNPFKGTQQVTVRTVPLAVK